MLIQRLCNVFAENQEDELQTAQRSLNKQSKVDKFIQEVQSRGKNPLEDGWDEAYHDGIEDHVLAERQSVRSSCEPSRFVFEDEGLTPDFDEDHVKSVLQKSLQKRTSHRR